MGLPSGVSGTSSLGCKLFQAVLYLSIVRSRIILSFSNINLAPNLMYSSSVVAQAPGSSADGHLYSKYVSGVHLCFLL